MINDHDAFEVDIESAFAETADVVTGSKEQRIQSEIAKR